VISCANSNARTSSSASGSRSIRILDEAEICESHAACQRSGAAVSRNPKGHSIRCSATFSARRTPSRLAWARNRSRPCATSAGLLAFLKEPEPPKGFKDLWEKAATFKQVLNHAHQVVKSAPCQEVVIEADDVDLAMFPIQTAGRATAGPLITWGPHGHARPLRNARTPAFIVSR